MDDVDRATLDHRAGRDRPRDGSGRVHRPAGDGEKTYVLPRAWHRRIGAGGTCTRGVRATRRRGRITHRVYKSQAAREVL